MIFRRKLTWGLPPRSARSFGGRDQFWRTVLPIAWSTWKKGHYLRSRNKGESSFCAHAKGLLFPSIDLCIVADRASQEPWFLITNLLLDDLSTAEVGLPIVEECGLSMVPGSQKLSF